MANGITRCTVDFDTTNADNVDFTVRRRVYGSAAAIVTIEAHQQSLEVTLTPEDAARLAEKLGDLFSRHPQLAKCVSHAEHPTLAKLLGLGPETEEGGTKDDEHSGTSIT